MKILEQTPSRLSILASTKGVKIFGGLFLFGGICISVVLPSKVSESLICNRNESICKIVRIGQLAGGAGTNSFPLGELKSASIKTNYSLDKKGYEHTNYEILLITKSYKDIFLTSATEKNDLISFTSEINNFVNDPVQPTLKLTNEKNFSTIKNIIFSLACIVGVITLLQDEVIYTFEKNSKILFIKRQGVRGNRIFSEPSINVSDVQIEKQTTEIPQNGKTYHFYNLNLLMTTGRKITLASSSDRDECNKIANDIRKIYGFR